MIRVAKLAEPAVLDTHRVQWTSEYLTALRDGLMTDTIRFRYRAPEIKLTLRAELFEKCAYCESKLTHVHPGEIDHILPVSQRPELIVAWLNLTLTCTECNRRKGAYYSVDEPLINPYEDDPDVHLRFYGPMCFATVHSRRGDVTVSLLELHRRQELVTRRAARIRAVQQLVQRWTVEANMQLKDALEASIRAEATAENEYAGAVRQFLRDHLGWDL